MPQVNGKHFAYTPEGIRAAKKEASMTGDRMYMNRGAAPMDRGAAPYRPMTNPKVAPGRYSVAGPNPGGNGGRGGADISQQFRSGVMGQPSSPYRSTSEGGKAMVMGHGSSRRPHDLQMFSGGSSRMM